MERFTQGNAFKERCNGNIPTAEIISFVSKVEDFMEQNGYNTFEDFKKDYDYLHGQINALITEQGELKLKIERQAIWIQGNINKARRCSLVQHDQAKIIHALRQSNTALQRNIHTWKDKWKKLKNFINKQLEYFEELKTYNSLNEEDKARIYTYNCILEEMQTLNENKE